MYYRISKNEKNLFFGKKIAQVWAVTLIDHFYTHWKFHLNGNLSIVIGWVTLLLKRLLLGQNVFHKNHFSKQ